jgi:hypothetical protein
LRTRHRCSWRHGRRRAGRSWPCAARSVWLHGRQ